MSPAVAARHPSSEELEAADFRAAMNAELTEHHSRLVVTAERPATTEEAQAVNANHNDLVVITRADYSANGSGGAERMLVRRTSQGALFVAYLTNISDLRSSGRLTLEAAT